MLNILYSSRIKRAVRLIALIAALSVMLTALGCRSVTVEPNPSSAEESLPVSENPMTEPVPIASSHPELTSEPTLEPEPVTEPEPEPEPDIRRVHIVCAGDNLIHSSIYNQARRRASANDEEGYDFSYVYEKVLHYLDGAQLAILNQETIVTDELEPSDYPRFTSPGDLGRHMIDIGFNVFSLSNNHILDRGEQGLLYTLDFWDSQEGITHYGAYRNQEDMDNIRILEVDGISFAFLGFMEHTNGLSLKDDSECRLTYLYETEEVKKYVTLASSLADVVIVSAHYGKETTNELTQNQLDMTELLFEWGADIIIGTQAHTVQTCGYYDKPDGSRGFVFYCLGNFVSAQSRYDTLVGIIGMLDVTKDMATGEISIENPEAIPIITQYGYNYSSIHIEPYAGYTEEMADSHGCEKLTIERIEKILSYVPEEFLSIR